MSTTTTTSRRDSRAHLAIQRQTDALLEFENFKRKYLQVNKHITKLNSSLSMRIETLNSQMSEMAFENLQLRTQVIQLNAQLARERDEKRRLLHDAEVAISSFSTRLGALRDVYGVESGPPPVASCRRKNPRLGGIIVRAAGASTPEPRPTHASRAPEFCMIAEEASDAESQHTEPHPARPSSRLDQHQHIPSVSFQVKPSKTKGKTVRRQSGLVADLLRDDREKREEKEPMSPIQVPFVVPSQAHLAPPFALGLDLVPDGLCTTSIPPSPQHEEMDIADADAGEPEPPAAIVAKKKQRRLSGPTPSPSRRSDTREDDEEADAADALYGSPLTEPEDITEEEEQRLRQMEEERQRQADAERRAAKEARARERELAKAQREREKDAARAIREKEKERTRLATEKHLKSAMEENLPPPTRVPFEPVTNSSTQTAKKITVPIVSLSTSTADGVIQSIKPTRIPGLSLVVNSSQPRSPIDTPRLHIPILPTPSESESTTPTEPPVALAPEELVAQDDGARTRRSRSSVNYAEPKLNTKMRRPDPAEGGPAWPPNNRKKKSSTTSSRPRVLSANDAIPDSYVVVSGSDVADGDALFAPRRHTIAVS